MKKTFIVVIVLLSLLVVLLFLKNVELVNRYNQLYDLSVKSMLLDRDKIERYEESFEKLLGKYSELMLNYDDLSVIYISNKNKIKEYEVRLAAYELLYGEIATDEPMDVLDDLKNDVEDGDDEEGDSVPIHSCVSRADDGKEKPRPTVTPIPTPRVSVTPIPSWPYPIVD